MVYLESNVVEMVIFNIKWVEEIYKYLLLLDVL